MIDCPDGLIRDELPAYVLGKLSPADHARIDAHVRACAACAAEIELLRSVSAAYPAPALDARRVASGVTAKLSGASARRVVRSWSFRGSVTMWQAAAALLVVAIGGLSLWQMRSAMSELPSAPTALTQDPNTATGHTQPAKATGTAPSATVAQGHAAEISFGGGLADLSEAQLRSLLASLDAIDSLPATDPESIAKPILPDRPTSSAGRQQ